MDQNSTWLCMRDQPMSSTGPYNRHTLPKAIDFAACDNIHMRWAPEIDSSSRQLCKSFTHALFSHFQGHKVAYIVFKNPKSVEKAMGLSALDPKVLSTEEKPIVTGMKSKFKKLNLPFWDDYEPFTVNQLNFACNLFSRISRFWQIRKIKMRTLYCRACSLVSGTS